MTTPTHGDPRKVLPLLREPFPKEQIGRLPATANRPALDFVGHAAVTDRLNRICPDWTFSILQRFEIGSTVWVHGRMEIAGVTREEYGQGKNPLEAASHFIRRAAMRFGVAIDLWSREELETGIPMAEVTSHGDPEPSYIPAAIGESSPELGTPAPGDGDPAPASADLWQSAQNIGLTPSKALLAARKRGWDHVRDPQTLTTEELASLIDGRMAELATT
jgi:hypothetical protein